MKKSLCIFFDIFCDLHWLTLQPKIFTTLCHPFSVVKTSDKSFMSRPNTMRYGIAGPSHRIQGLKTSMDFWLGASAENELINACTFFNSFWRQNFQTSTKIHFSFYSYVLLWNLDKQHANVNREGEKHYLSGLNKELTLVVKNLCNERNDGDGNCTVEIADKYDGDNSSLGYTFSPLYSNFWVVWLLANVFSKWPSKSYGTRTPMVGTCLLSLKICDRGSFYWVVYKEI